MGKRKKTAPSAGGGDTLWCALCGETHFHALWRIAYSTPDVSPSDNASDALRQLDGNVWRCTGGKNPPRDGQDNSSHRTVVKPLQLCPDTPPRFKMLDGQPRQTLDVCQKAWQVRKKGCSSDRLL